MKKPIAVVGVIFAAALVCLGAGAQTQSDARAKELIDKLHLTVLPKESGYLGIIGVSAQKVAIDGRALAVQSQNY